MQQGEIAERARAAIAEIVAPVVAKLAPGEKLDAEQMRRIYRGLAPLGYLGGLVPRDLGGHGMGFVAYGLLLEALAESPVLLSEIVVPQTLVYIGNDEQRRRYLPGLLSGDLVATAAITEPQAGSDLRNLQTTALPRNGRLVVNGRKKWIKLGGVADLMTVLAVTHPEAPHGQRTSRILLDRHETPWASTEIPCVGIRNLSFVEAALDALEVSPDNLLGVPGKGVEAFTRAIEASRALIGVQAAGLARVAIDRAVAYAGQRHAFGRPLARFQAIQLSLAEAAARVEAARQMALAALAKLDAGQRCPREASMAKVFGTETAVTVCAAAMDCMGAYGLSEEAGVERLWRDAKMLTVIDGASGIQRLIVGREMFGTAAFV